jgi:hypothetical protein
MTPIVRVDLDSLMLAALPCAFAGVALPFGTQA